jgi:hypothetical protein
VTDKLITTLKELPVPKRSGVLEYIKSRLAINAPQATKREHSQAIPMNGLYLWATYKECSSSPTLNKGWNKG